MKKIYERPEMMMEGFRAEEFCTTCSSGTPTTAICNANPNEYINDYVLCYLWKDSYYDENNIFHRSERINSSDRDNGYHVACGEEFSIDANAFTGYYTPVPDETSMQVPVIIQPIENGTTIPWGPNDYISHYFHATTTVVTRS